VKKAAFFYLALVFLFSENIFGQDTTETFQKAKNTIFLEGGGNGGYGSINYERYLRERKRNYLTCRIGFSYLPFGTAGRVYSVPFAFEFGYRNNKTVFSEFGLGISYINGLYSSYSNGISYASSALYLSMRLLGLRVQKPNGGFFFNIGWTPFLKLMDFNSSYVHYYTGDSDKNVIEMVAIGMGYTIKHK